MTDEQKWWRNPQGIVAAITIATAVLGFFYVRERKFWELDSRMAALELRGSAAIVQAGNRLERVETVLREISDRVNFLERKIDRLELKDQEQEEKIKGFNSSHQ